MNMKQSKYILGVVALIAVVALFVFFNNKHEANNTENEVATSVEVVDSSSDVNVETESSISAKQETAESVEEENTLDVKQETDTNVDAKTPVEQVTDANIKIEVEYKFRNDKLLSDHYEKHGIEMGFDSKESYEKAASNVINNPAALIKPEKEDDDMVYYVESSNEFVILSDDGYIRTYFYPSAGKAYFDRQ